MVNLEADLLGNSTQQIELYARIGSQMGHLAHSHDPSPSATHLA